MKMTAEQYALAVTGISLRSVGATRAETLIDGEGTVHEEPERLWFVLSWAASGLGCGEASFYTTGDGLSCDDEAMGATFVEGLLMALARKTKMTGK